MALMHANYPYTRLARRDSVASPGNYGGGAQTHASPSHHSLDRPSVTSLIPPILALTTTPPRRPCAPAAIQPVQDRLATRRTGHGGLLRGRVSVVLATQINRCQLDSLPSPLPTPLSYTAEQQRRFGVDAVGNRTPVRDPAATQAPTLTAHLRFEKAQY